MKQKYIEKIEKMVREGVIPRSAVSAIEVRHDHWCPILSGMGACSCNPEITLSSGTDHD